MSKFMIDEWYPDMKWNIPMTIYSFENYTIEKWKKLRYNEKRQLLINYDGKILTKSLPKSLLHKTTFKKLGGRTLSF